MRALRHSGGQAVRRSGFSPERPNASTPEHPNARTPERRNGFTLIEMLVLIMIIAIVSSVAVPAYGRFLAKAKFHGATQRVVSLLAWARDSAIQHGADTVVRFDSQTETMVASSESPSPVTDVPLALQDSQEAAAATPEPRAVTLGEDVIITDFTAGLTGASQAGGGMAANELRFHEDGHTEGARMILRSINGYAAMIEIAPATGAIHVMDQNDAGF